MAVNAASPNRSLFRMNNYDCVGFDMDHTLCRYRLPAFLEMEYQALADYLISHKGYNERLKRPLAEDIDFLHKGLVMDVERGNFVKLSAEGDVLRASHGTRLMNNAEIAAHYGQQRSNDGFKYLAANPIDATEGPLHRKYRPFKDYFDMPAALICARIVDHLDFENGNKPLEKYSFWRDVLYGLVDMFNRDNLKLNTGGYYPQMKLNPELYLRPCADQLKNWLKELKKRQVTYLISGSDPSYVEWVAAFCLGNDWKNYFDFIVCASKKPGFFTGQRPFRRWNGVDEHSVDDEDIDINEFLPANKPFVYIHGNWSQLKSSMAEYSGADHPRCLYFGDHFIQDVVAADLNRLEVVAIVEELAAEQNRGLPDDDRLLLTSTMWGSFFKDDGLLYSSEHRTVTTLWADLLRKHARLCSAHVDTFSDYPVDHGFVVQHDQQSKFLGFLPFLPQTAAATLQS